MATNDNSFLNFIQNGYLKYRSWQKSRGRAKKAQKLLARGKTFYSNFIKPGDLCFDIGANLGNRSEMFLALGAKVIALEPQQLCIDALKEKFASNPNFILIEKAVSNEEGQAEFYISNAHTLSSMSKEWIDFSKTELFKEGKWDDKVTVETIPLDKIISKHGVPQFCKIDVEGFELTVLEGLSQSINIVSFEYTLGLLDATLNCIKYLGKLGPAQFNYSEGESLDLKLPDWISLDEMIKLLQGLRSEALGGDIYVRFVS